MQEQITRTLMNTTKKYTIEFAKHFASLLALVLVGEKKAEQDLYLVDKLKKGGELSPKDIKALKKMGYNLKSVTVDAELVHEWKDAAKRCGVAFGSVEIKDDNAYHITYPDSHSDRASHLSLLMAAKGGNEPKVDMETFAFYYQGYSTGEIRGLNAQERELFKQNAYSAFREGDPGSGVLYSFEEVDEDTFNVHYGKEYSKEIERILALSCLDLTSTYKDEIVEKINIRIENKDLVDRALEGEIDEDIFIVSVTNPERVIKLTALDYTDYNGKKVLRSLNRDEHEFRQEFNLRLAGLGVYAVFNKDDFNKYKDNKDALHDEANYRFNIFPEEHLDERNQDIDLINNMRAAEAAYYAEKFTIINHSTGTNQDKLFEKETVLKHNFFRRGRDTINRSNEEKQKSKNSYER